MAGHPGGGWPGADYNRQVQQARLLLTGAHSLSADTVALWDQLLAATIEAIAADAGAGRITPERAEQLKRSIGHHLGRLNAAYDGVLSGAAEATGATVASAHRRALAAAGSAAGATLRASFAELPRDVLAYSLARRQSGGSQQLKGLASRGLSHLAGDVDDILFTGMARGISSRRLTEELGAAMAAGDAAVLAAVKDPRLRRALRAANPEDPVYRAAMDLRRYGRMVAVSEINEAHRSAQVLAAMRSPVVGTLTWTRSGRHAGLRSSPCECDVLATKDAYKLGPGVYPKHAYPAAPHPHCACFPTMNARPPGEWGTPVPYPEGPPLPVSEGEVRRLFTRLGHRPTPARVRRAVAGVNGNAALAFEVGQQGHKKVLAALQGAAQRSEAAAGFSRRTLEELLGPFAPRRFKSPAAAQEWAAGTWRPWLKNLSEAELTALEHYKGSDYEIMQAYFRGGEKAVREAIPDWIDPAYIDTVVADHIARAEAASAALRKGEFAEDVWVYRGTDLRGRKARDLVGTVMQEKGIASTTLDRNVGAGWAVAENKQPVLLEIRARKGTRGAFLDFDEIFDAGEREVALPAGSKWYVREAKKTVVDTPSGPRQIDVLVVDLLDEKAAGLAEKIAGGGARAVAAKKAAEEALAAAKKHAAQASVAAKKAAEEALEKALAATAKSKGSVAGLKGAVEAAEEALAAAKKTGNAALIEAAEDAKRQAREALAAKRLANKKAASKHNAKKKLEQAEALAAAGDLEAAKKASADALKFATAAEAEDFVALAKQKAAEIEAALAKPALDAAGFPVDAAGLAELEFVQNLGGSTGARLYRHPKSGKLFVRKTGANAGHLLEETFADAAYRAAGADVPDFRLYTGPGGQPVKLSAFLPEDARSLKAVLAGADEALKAEAIGKIRQDFALDALLGNWDVIGLELDNVMVTGGKGGLRAYRIDNGGSLRYRAMGAKKTPAQWSAVVGELQTLRDPAMNPSAARVFAGLTDEQVAAQIEALAAKRKAVLQALPEELRGIVGQRLDNMEAWAAGVKKAAKAAAEVEAKAQAALTLALENPGNVAVLKDAVAAAEGAVAAAKKTGSTGLVATAKKALKTAEDTLAAKQLANKKSSKKYAAKKKLEQAEALLGEPTAAGLVPADEATLQKALEKLESALADAKFAGAPDIEKAVAGKLDAAKKALAAGSAEAQVVVKKAGELAGRVEASSGSVAKLKKLIASAEKLGSEASALGNPKALAAAEDTLKKAQDTLAAKQLANKVSSKKYAAKKALGEAGDLLAAGQAAKASKKLQSAGKNLAWLDGRIAEAELKALVSELDGKLKQAQGGMATAPPAAAPGAAAKAAKKAPAGTAKKKLAAANQAAEAKKGPPKPKSPTAAEAKAIAAAEEQLGYAKKGTTDYWLGKTVQEAESLLQQPAVQASPYAKHAAEQALELAKGKKAALAGTTQGVSAEALENLAEALLEKAKTNTNQTLLENNAHYAQTAAGVAKQQGAPAAIVAKLEDAAKLSQQNKQILQNQAAAQAQAHAAPTPGVSTIGPKGGSTHVLPDYGFNHDAARPAHTGNFKHFDTRQAADTYGKHEWGPWAARVTDQEVAGIRSYKSSGHGPQNRYLRGETTYLSDADRQSIRNIDAALARPEARLKEPTMLYRGTSLKRAWEAGTDLIGQTLDDQAFMSTSFSRGLSHGWDRYNDYPVLFEFRAPAGTPGAYLDARPGLPNAREYEFLVARGAHFEVTGVRTEIIGGREMRIIEADIVGIKAKVKV